MILRKQKSTVSLYLGLQSPTERTFAEERLGWEWKIACIMNRRVPNIEGNELAGGKEARWPWDAFVQGESAEAIGRHIAASFNSFAHHQKFAFNRVVSNRRELRPLSYYLLEDVHC